MRNPNGRYEQAWSNCVAECRRRAVLAICLCTPHTKPVKYRREDEATCSLEHLSCLDKHKGKISTRQIPSTIPMYTLPSLWFLLAQINVYFSVYAKESSIQQCRVTFGGSSRRRELIEELQYFLQIAAKLHTTLTLPSSIPPSECTLCLNEPNFYLDEFKTHAKQLIKACLPDNLLMIDCRRFL